MRVRDARPIAAALLSDDEQEADAVFALLAQRHNSRDLRRKDSFRVARPSAVQAIALDTAWKEGWDAVEVRRQNDGWRLGDRENIESRAIHRLRDALRHHHEGFEHAHHEHADADHVHPPDDGHPMAPDGTGR